MKKGANKPLEKFRVRRGPIASSPSDGCNGAFIIPGPLGCTLNVVVSDGAEWAAAGLPGKPWEHVSVSTQIRTPSWEEMDFVKRLFWRDDETVLQLHVPRSQHVNHHEHCLHLWRPIGVEIPLPPSITVGPLLSNPA